MENYKIEKILVFSPYYPPHVGGLESHAEEFNREMRKLGFEVSVFTPRLPINSSSEERDDAGVRVFRYPAFEIINNYPVPVFWRAAFWKMISNLNKDNYKIVVSRTRFFLSSLMALVFARISGAVFVHIEHGSDFTRLSNPLINAVARLYDYTFGRFILMTADEVVANSEASAKFAKQLYKKRNYHVVYRGVLKQRIAAVSLAAEKDDPEEIVVVYIGRLISGKGVDILLRAFATLQKERVKCWIIGDGKERKNLSELASQLRVTDKVVFTGEKKFNEAIGLLKDADILVNPSYTEGLPTSVIEAALCGKAIIATDVGGTKEIVTENSAILVPPGDVEKLAKALERLSEDEKFRVGLGQKAYQDVSGKFDWSKSALQYEKIFKNVLRDRAIHNY